MATLNEEAAHLRKAEDSCERNGAKEALKDCHICRSCNHAGLEYPLNTLYGVRDGPMTFQTEQRRATGVEVPIYKRLSGLSSTGAIYASRIAMRGLHTPIACSTTHGVTTHWSLVGDKAW
ncbi:hypothetical protein N7447_008991 [Penicillium robsamsonii]|uniref:uncharacterized protein n=1 Tax=Penicillium robsamsonii TaxID=1792511 RepID=UPI00254895B5|nr:uncharacterized protein N7447_008991 [Penicillium robsamsonii]KAJ5816758.1 hypothetical protein N7447_008991 [Penicillium robsamsonii]